MSDPHPVQPFAPPSPVAPPPAAPPVPPAPQPPAAAEEGSKHALQSATIWGALMLLEPIITEAQKWATMTPDERTKFLITTFGVVMVVFGRLRQGDLRLWR